jgi:Ni/Co efflux regulator RcnB
MKRAALGALVISLVAGSTAMAGSNFPPGALNRSDRQQQNERNGHEQHRPDNRNDARGPRDDRHDNDHRNDRPDDHGNRGNFRDDHRWDGRRDDRSWNDNHRDDRRWLNPPRNDHRWENGRYHWGVYQRPYGYAPQYWRRGDRLPRVYYGSSYVVGNYYDCGLRAPPYGYHWVRVDHDVVLAAIATGVVLDVIYNQFW